MVLLIISLIVIILLGLPLSLTFTGTVDQRVYATLSIRYLFVQRQKKVSLDWSDLLGSLHQTEALPEVMAQEKMNKVKKPKKKILKPSFKQSLETWLPHIKKTMGGFRIERLEVDYTLGMARKDILGLVAGGIWSVLGTLPNLEQKSIFLSFKPNFEKNDHILAVSGIILVPLGHIIGSCLFFVGLYLKQLLSSKYENRKRSAHCG